LIWRDFVKAADADASATARRSGWTGDEMPQKPRYPASACALTPRRSCSLFVPMARDGSWSSGSWKSSPWRDGPRRTGADSAAPRAEAGKILPGPTGGTRLADLREWHVVEARCARCRHVGRLRPKQLTAFIARRRHQPVGQTRLAEIQPRFACSECGNRAGNDLAIVAIERNM
jgi:hypothetical protein